MTPNEEQHREHNQPRVDGGIIIDTRLEDIERQRREGDERQQEYNRRQLRFNKWLVIFTGLLFFANCVSLVLICWQIGVASRGADAAKSAAATANAALESNSDSVTNTMIEMKSQSRAMHRSAEAAKNASDIANSALKSQQRVFEIDQRPYLVTASPPIFVDGFSAGKDIKANITIRNIGRTPAIKIFTHATVATFYASRTDRKRYIDFITATFADLRKRNAVGREEIEGTRIERDVAPTGDFFVTNQNSVSIPVKDFPLTQTADVSVFYAGITSYTDAFRRSYTTEFCYYYWGTDLKTWHFCDSNNSIK